MLVDSSIKNEYAEPIPINPIYKPAFMAIYQLSQLKSMNVQVVHNMAPAESEKRSNLDVGVFTAKFGSWACTLNWTEEKRGGLPPDYIGVDFGDVSCGIIGLHLTIRTCWNCGLTGWKDASHRRACVRSSFYTNEGVWVSRHCPKCYQPDWWASTIEPSRFMRDCAEAIASRTKKPRLWKSFGGTEMDQQIASEKLAS